jgi:CDP-diacylglycerol--serine O-phosphatidyltransferase
MLTLANLTCGFAAVHFGLRALYAAGCGIDASVENTLNNELVERMLPSFLAIGAMLIFLGMLLDMLDGLAARWTRNATTFGAQLDSLADVVSFGVAPAILAVALMMREWSGYQVVVTPLSAHALGRLMWVCAAVYCLCAAVRLARFNVEHDLPDYNRRSFRGLPSPGAAAVIASLVMLHEHVASPTVRNLLLYCLPVMALVTAYLMVSRIRYQRLTQAYLIRRRPFEHLLLFVVVFVVFLSYKAQTLATLCCLYALSGPVAAAYRRLRAASPAHAEQAGERKPDQESRTSG